MTDLICSAKEILKYKEMGRDHEFFKEKVGKKLCFKHYFFCSFSSLFVSIFQADFDPSKAFPSSPLFTEDTVYDSCAIVSNSANLIGSGLGEEIDSHDFVMRFNVAPTKGSGTPKHLWTQGFFLLNSWFLQ